VAAAVRVILWSQMAMVKNSVFLACPLRCENKFENKGQNRIKAIKMIIMGNIVKKWVKY